VSDQLTMSVGPAHATAIGIAGDLTTLPVADLVAAVDHMIRWWGASTWVLGDLVVEMLRRARDGDQLPEHVWSNLHQASAARAGTLAAEFPPERRRASLTWSHHAAVMGLTERNQDRLLAVAEAEGLSAKQLAAVVDQEARDLSPGLDGAPVVPPTRWKPAPRLAVRVGALLAAHPEAKGEIDAAVDGVLRGYGA